MTSTKRSLHCTFAGQERIIRYPHRFGVAAGSKPTHLSIDPIMLKRQQQQLNHARNSSRSKLARILTYVTRAEGRGLGQRISHRESSNSVYVVYFTVVVVLRVGL